MNTTLLLLLVAFQVKHMIADYFLQTQYMLKKGETGTTWILPLTLHAGVHSFFTLQIICLAGYPHLFWLAGVDFLTHFTIDRVKAVISRGASPATNKFWFLLGADQMAHHLSHYAFIYYMVTYG